MVGITFDDVLKSLCVCLEFKGDGTCVCKELMVFEFKV
jgi:hypothetical protein